MRGSGARWEPGLPRSAGVPHRVRGVGRAILSENRRLRQENERLTAELERTRAVLEIVGKAHALLETISGSAEKATPSTK